MQVSWPTRLPMSRRGTVLNRFRRVVFFNFASLPLIFLGGPAGYAIRQAAGLMLPLQMLRFNRRAEREADFLGLQYLYKAGYDPTAFVSFFEKVKSQEKRKSGFFAKAFSTHPVTEDRIRKAQQQIEQALPAREEYALSSSEFERIKARLEVLENARKREAEKEEDPDRPRLQRRTSNTIEDEEESASETGEEYRSPTHVKNETLRPDSLPGLPQLN